MKHIYSIGIIYDRHLRSSKYFYSTCHRCHSWWSYYDDCKMFVVQALFDFVKKLWLTNSEKKLFKCFHQLDINLPPSCFRAPRKERKSAKHWTVKSKNGRSLVPFSITCYVQPLHFTKKKRKMRYIEHLNPWMVCA